MHKKLFIAVLALGLLLLAVPSFASLGIIPPDGYEKPVHTWGHGSKSGSTIAAVAPNTVVTANAGTNRTVPGTFCDGQWQGAFAGGISGWYAGNEFYCAYQNPADPTWFGGACAPTAPSFDVTAINAILANGGASAGTFSFQPMVWSGSDPSWTDISAFGEPTAVCSEGPPPVAGGADCVGPLYAFNMNVGTYYILNMPFPTECCQTGDYYAGYYGATSGALVIGTDRAAAAIPGSECAIFNEYGGGWDAIRPIWEAFLGTYDNHEVWSEGFTPDDPATHCNPGTCGYSFAYTTADSQAVRFEDGNDDWFTGFVIPSAAATGATRWGARFDAIGLDTLKEFKVLVYDGFSGAAGPDDLLIEVWDQGPATGCNGEKVPGSLIYSVGVPAASVVYYPTGMTTVPMPDITFGTLNGGPERSIFVTVTTTNGGKTGAAMGWPTTTLGCLTTPFRAHSLLYYPNWLGLGSAAWKYVGERAPTAGHFEFDIDAQICREVLPAQESDCSAPGADSWRSYAHDNRQTSASSIQIGDPNQVTVSWTQPLPATSNFANPSVAGEVVYISSEARLDAFDLSTGAAVGVATGSPNFSTSGNRGNTAIAFTHGLPSGPDRDVVFATGGSFFAITAYEANLSAAIWSRNSSLGNSLTAQSRFNCSKVVSIAGTDVLFVTTDPLSGTGKLWAINAGTGALYAGWTTNPVILDQASKCGPAVDGGKLYVGTAIGGTNVSGSLYQIDAATGTVNWNFVSAVGDGWPSGVSVEGNFLYGATKDASNIGHRYKIDKSGAGPVVVWSAQQGTGLYGTPTIGRDFVYFPLDNPNFGLLQVDKGIGTVARNFGNSVMCGTSLFMVPQIATLSCDAYLFAGDRNGRWWMFNAVTGEPEWYREFPGLVNGTALAHSATANSDYAVVGIQGGTPAGMVASYKLNAGPRPRLLQCVTEETVIVPLGSGPGNSHSVPDVFSNIGDMPLNFSALSYTDPPGAAAAHNDRQAVNSFNNAARQFDGYTTIASASTIGKRERLAGLSSDMIDGGEATFLDALRAKSVSSRGTSRSGSRGMAASASSLRTSAVLVGGAAVPTSLAPNSSAGLDWTYDGTGLGRGADANDLEFTMDDPDFNYDGSPIATFHILYQGGCLHEMDTLNFGAGNSELVFNYGALGARANVKNYYFDGNDGFLYDAGLYLIGDSTSGVNGGAQVFCEIYDGASNGRTGGFVPNVAPVSGQCGFDVQRNILLGAKRTGGCPGTPVDIMGEMITNSISDTDFAAPAGTRLAAVGMDIVQTEVGAYDPLYGDFKLIQWVVTNRDAVAKGPIYVGTWSDWDIASYANNTGNYSAAANGYFIWDNSDPSVGAYGNLDPSQRSTYSGTQPMNPARRIVIMDGALRQNGFWPGVDVEGVYFEGVNQTPLYDVDPPAISDKQGWLLNGGRNFGPNSTEKYYQAMYGGVDATSADNSIIDVNVQALAKRAARWAGFARGDVNDDGIVDLADVCWLQGGNPVYPAAYSGDVNASGGAPDAADVAQLLSYVSGNAGAQPQGAWRF